MDIILKDGVRFIRHSFDRESDFEKVVLQQTKHIFGDDAVLFNKRKIETETGIKTVPDAFVVCPSSRKWYVIEVELASHSVYHHIVPQINKFKSALSTLTRKSLVKFFDKEIENDLHKLATWASATKDSKNVHRHMSEILDEEPELIILINESNPELDTASKNLPFHTSVNVFKTYCREGVGLGDSIYQFDPVTIKRNKVSVKAAYTPPEMPDETLVEDTSSFREEKQLTRKVVNNSPSASVWVKTVPELTSVAGLSDWKKICEYLNIDVGADSARRVLKKWVAKNKSNWPPVPGV